MTNIKLLTETAADIDSELQTLYDIGILPTWVTVFGEDYSSDPSWLLPPSKELFLEAFEKKEYPTVFQPSAFLWKEEVEKYIKEGYNKILYISLSKRFGGGCKQFTILKTLLKAQYPDVELEVIDSTSVGAALKLQVIRVAEYLRHENHSFEEACSFAESLTKKTQVFWLPKDNELINFSGRASKLEEELPYPIMYCEDGKLVEKFFKTHKERIDYLTNHFKESPIRRVEATYSYDKSKEDLFELIHNISSSLDYTINIANKITLFSPTTAAVVGLDAMCLGVEYK